MYDINIQQSNVFQLVNFYIGSEHINNDNVSNMEFVHNAMAPINFMIHGHGNINQKPGYNENSCESNFITYTGII